MVPPWRERPQRRSHKRFVLFLLIFIVAFGGVKWCATDDSSACTAVNTLTTQTSQLFDKAVNNPQVTKLRSEVSHRVSPYWNPLVDWVGPHVDQANVYASRTYEKWYPVVEAQSEQAKEVAAKWSHAVLEQFKREAPKFRDHAERAWLHGRQASLDIGRFLWIKVQKFINELKERFPIWKQTLVVYVESFLQSNSSEAVKPSESIPQTVEEKTVMAGTNTVEAPTQTSAEAEVLNSVYDTGSSVIEKDDPVDTTVIQEQYHDPEYEEAEETTTLTLTRTQTQVVSTGSPSVEMEEIWLRRVNRTVDGAIKNLESDVNATLLDIITDAKPGIQQELREITRLGDEYIVLATTLAEDLKNGAMLAPSDVYPQFKYWSNDLAEHALKVRQLAQKLADSAIEAVQSLREVVLEALDDYFDVILSEAGRQAASATEDEWSQWRSYHALKRRVGEIRAEAQTHDVSMEVANVALRESQQIAVFMVQNCNARLNEMRAMCQLALQKMNEEANSSTNEKTDSTDSEEEPHSSPSEEETHSKPPTYSGGVNEDKSHEIVHEPKAEQQNEQQPLGEDELEHLT